MNGVPVLLSEGIVIDAEWWFDWLGRGVVVDVEDLDMVLLNIIKEWFVFLIMSIECVVC